LPWFVGQIMPDVFTGLAVLGMFILGFGPGRLSARERNGVLVLTALAIAVHLSHLPLALGLLAVMPVVGGLTGAWRPFRWQPLAAGGGALLLAIGAVVSTNIIYRGRVTLSPNGQIFMLARLVADGPAVAYLREHCPQEHFALCADLNRIPMDASSFLWRLQGPLESAGGPDALRAEAGAIVLGCARSYPMWILRSAARNTMKQLRRFDTGWEYGPYVDREGMPGRGVPSAIHRFFPDSYPRYLSARQNMGRLGVGALLWPHRLAVGASLMLGLLYLALRRRQDPVMAAFILFVGASVLLGAIVTGVISEPADRYGSRMAWPIVLAALMSLISLRSPPGRDRRMAAAG